MKKLLHIIATPRQDDSRTLQVSKVFLETFKQHHADWVVEDLDLSKEVLPALTIKRVDGKYVLLSGKELYGDIKEAWDEIIAHIERFLSADAYLISTPLWNFGIPYMLKHYIDVILQPKYLFHYTATGPEGLVKNRKMLVITSRGGDYESEEMKKLDFEEPYLRVAFGFAGISDITFINAQPMDMGREIQKAKIKKAQEEARKIAVSF
jgi:FMN-dependent NADH-azoreductase